MSASRPSILASKGRRCVSFGRSAPQKFSMIWGFLRGIAWSSSKVIEQGNTVSGSMTSGGSGSCGPMRVQRRLRSLTTTDKIEPIHPGEVLMEDFIKGFGITQNKVAVAIGVPPRRINEIVHGKRGITADTALRLGRYFSIDPQFWLNLQSQYELDLARDSGTVSYAAIAPVQVA